LCGKTLDIFCIEVSYDAKSHLLKAIHLKAWLSLFSKSK